MSEPRVNLRGKKINSANKMKKTDTQNWAGQEQPPRPHEPSRIPKSEEKAVDYWTPYMQHVRKKPKKFGHPRRPLPAAKKRAGKQPGRAEHSILKLVISGGSAVLVGTLMGLLILKVFVGGGPPPGGTTSEGANTIDTHLEKTPSLADNPKDSATAGDRTAELPGIDSFWVQGGVYSGKEGAEAFAAEQRESGQAAVVRKMGDEYRVFFGVGLTRDDALNIASEIKDSGGDVYLKDDLSVRAASLDHLSQQLGQQLQVLATEGGRIVTSLGTFSAAGIGGTDIQGDLSSEMTNIEQAHRAFITALSEVKATLPEEQQQAVDTMGQALAQSVEAAKQYEQETSTGYLWQMQEGLMQYLLAYEQLGK